MCKRQNLEKAKEKPKQAAKSTAKDCSVEGTEMRIDLKSKELKIRFKFFVKYYAGLSLCSLKIIYQIISLFLECLII